MIPRARIARISWWRRAWLWMRGRRAVQVLFDLHWCSGCRAWCAVDGYCAWCHDRSLSARLALGWTPVEEDVVSMPLAGDGVERRG